MRSDSCSTPSYLQHSSTPDTKKHLLEHGAWKKGEKEKGGGGKEEKKEVEGGGVVSRGRKEVFLAHVVILVNNKSINARVPSL